MKKNKRIYEGEELEKFVEEVLLKSEIVTAEELASIYALGDEKKKEILSSWKRMFER